MTSIGSTSLAATFCSLMLTASVSAQVHDKNNERAPSPEPTRDSPSRAAPPSYQLSIDPSLGVGGGSPGFGGRLGVSGEYWLSSIAGIGLESALFGQAAIFGDESSAGTIALVGALRTAPRHGYGIFTVGAGYARAKHIDKGGLCIDLFGNCPKPRTRSYDGYTIGIALGWLAHPGDSWFEIGPVGRVDIVVDPHGRSPADYLITLNLALGYALLR
jgi:hypothetical protein